MIVQAPTMTELFHASCERLLYAKRERLGNWGPNSAMMFSNILIADSMEFDLDLSDLWFTKYRFGRLQRDYLLPAECSHFLDRCHMINDSYGKKGFIAQMMCRTAQTLDGQMKHTWGNCMLAFTYQHSKRTGSRPVLSLHSRTSYLSSTGGVDLALAWVLAREIAREDPKGKLSVEDFQFRWILDSCSWHAFKGIGYVIEFGHEEEINNERKYPQFDYPLVGLSRRYLARLAAAGEAGPATKENAAYGQWRRMVRRWRRAHGYEDRLPPVPIAGLELIPAMLNNTDRLEGPPGKSAWKSNPRTPTSRRSK